MAEVTKEMILQAIVSLEERLRGDIKDVRDEVKGMAVDLAEVKILAKAVDKDAETIISHEKRITNIEKQLTTA